MKLEIWLENYVTPSPNETRYRHWRFAMEEKRKARRALLSGLRVILPTYWTAITSGDLAKQSLIACAIRSLSLAMVKNKSSSSLTKRRSNIARTLGL